MQRSPSTSSCEPARRPSFRRDETAVSEAIGYAITFGILSIVLVASLTAFNRAQEDAEERVVGLRAASAAQRVAGSIVEVAILAEGGGLDSYRRDVLLPPQFEGHDYTVTIGPGDDSVIVAVDGRPDPITEPLFGAISSSTITVCSALDTTPVSGGALRVTFTVSGGVQTLCLEEAS